MRDLNSEILSSVETKNIVRQNLLGQRLKEYERKLYIILSDLQSVIISKRVMHNSRKTVHDRSLIDNDEQIYDDLIIHSVQQMFQYLDKVDLDRKIYSIFQRIAHFSTQVHYFSYYQMKNVIVIDNNCSNLDENQDFDYMTDKLYYEKNKNAHLDHFDKLFDEQILEMQDSFDDTSDIILDDECLDDNKNWVKNFDIFKTIDSILKFGFCNKDLKGILLKLYIINVLMYNQVFKFDTNMYVFNLFVSKKVKYIKKIFNLKNGFEKIIKMVIDDYIKKDPMILIGTKQMSLYQSLLLYILLLQKKISYQVFSQQEIQCMQYMKHELQDITELLLLQESKQGIDFNNTKTLLDFTVIKENVNYSTVNFELEVVNGNGNIIQTQ